MKEYRAHAWSDPPHYSYLSTEPGVLVAVLDDDLNVRAVPVLAAEDVVVPADWVVRRLAGARSHGRVAQARRGRSVAG